MELTKADIDNIANLAHLEISSQEREQYKRELSEVLDYMEILEEVDTTDVSATAQVSDKVNGFRQDQVQAWPEAEKEKTLQQSPNYKQGKINIDKIIDT